MRCIVTGSDENGRSRIVREVERPLATTTTLWDTTSDGLGDLPRAVRRNSVEGEIPVSSDTGQYPIGMGEPHDLHVPPGDSWWVMIFYDPNQEYPMHWTATIDFDYIVSGEIDLVLDSETITLKPGDCAVIAGVRHQWRPGPEGCQMLLAICGQQVDHV